MSIGLVIFISIAWIDESLSFSLYHAVFLILETEERIMGEIIGSSFCGEFSQSPMSDAVRTMTALI